MKRYCPNCRKEYEFEIKDISLPVCPGCGMKLSGQDRNPEKVFKTEAMEMKIGNTIGKFYYLVYMFYALCGIIGAVCYFTGHYNALYVISIVSTPLYLWRYGLRSWDFLIIAIGGLAAGLILRTLPGICLGIMFGMILRVIIIRLIIRLAMYFLDLGNRGNEN